MDNYTYLCAINDIFIDLMKQIRLIAIALIALLTASCASHKRIWYLQDAIPYTPEQIEQQGQIRIQPFDRLTIVVNSKDPLLAVPFNETSSMNSLSSTGSTYSSNGVLQIRTVDEEGYLDMPVLGRIQCKGMTRSQLSHDIARRIIEGEYIKDPIVNVQFADMKISVIGEVARPGQYTITNDKITIFDALAMAGDMTVYGIRNDVAVYREVDGVRTIEYLDLTSKDIFQSPAFYIRQNDAIYVKPNKYKAQAGEISQNRSFYISLVSTAISMATLIVTISKL